MAYLSATPTLETLVLDEGDDPHDEVHSTSAQRRPNGAHPNCAVAPAVRISRWHIFCGVTRSVGRSRLGSIAFARRHREKDTPKARQPQKHPTSSTRWRRRRSHSQYRGCSDAKQDIPARASDALPIPIRREKQPTNSLEGTAKNLGRDARCWDPSGLRHARDECGGALLRDGQTQA